CSRSELRFLWPSILPLMTADERYEVLCASARELADVKVPKNLPALPPGLREAMRKTTETVAVMGLIPADVADKPVQAQVSVQVSDGGDFNEPGIGSFHGVYG
ncbi:MAG: hypothetical protein ACXWC0_27450, partial [Burkholderiales bacterium]